MARTKPSRRGAAPKAAGRPKPRARARVSLAPYRLAVWAVVTVALLVVIAMTLERQITWYLAVDQFGYVSFANDLLHGRIYHDWAPAEALRHVLRPKTDMLAQTYIWDDGYLYSRYAPGFPILLAGWILTFGEELAHFLNPTLFIGLLVLVIVFQWELARSLWRGTTAVALVFVCPTFAYLWGLTLTRDMSAHVFGLAGLTLLLTRRHRLSPRRLLVAGLCLGFAGTIRPDAVMYLLPAVIIATWRCVEDRGGRRALLVRAGWGAGGVALGLLPSLAFYAATTGNPFVPTQAVELKRLWSRAVPALVTPAMAASPGWSGGTLEQVQGGGLRVSNLRDTLRGNWGKIRYGYGPLLVALAVWGAVVGIVLRPMFATAGLAYVALAILFFSMWTRPDSRYLIGVWVMVPMFIVEGLAGSLDLVRWVWRRRRPELARALALALGVALLAGYWFLGTGSGEWRGKSPMPTLTTMLVAWGVLAAVAAAIWPGRRVATWLVPVLMLTAVGVAGVHAEQRLVGRASFQRPQAERARTVFRSAVEPNGVVITSEDVGRPMENIEHYADRRALYLTDLRRWKLTVPRAVRHLYLKDMQPYLLLQKRTLDSLLPELREAGFEPVLVADIPPRQNYDYFVAAPFHRGLPMQLWRIDWPFGDLLRRLARNREEAARRALETE